MPSFDTGYYGPSSKAILACRASVRQQMIAAGWHPAAKKFSEVCYRRALRMAWGQK